MRRPLIRDQRGSVLIFTTALLVFLLVFAGLAVDLDYYMWAKGEVQRMVDAAALAGAAKLQFKETPEHDAARAYAQQFRELNGLHGFTAVSLQPGNGDITLGVWNGTAFAPPANATEINAVQCRYTVAVPTAFLRLLGINSLATFATATAVSFPPRTPPPPPRGESRPLRSILPIRCGHHTFVRGLR